MITRFVIEGLLVLAVIIGFIFEEKIALAERRFLKKLFARSLQKKARQEHIQLKMREARYQRQQMQRELENARARFRYQALFKGDFHRARSGTGGGSRGSRLKQAVTFFTFLSILFYSYDSSGTQCRRQSTALLCPPPR